VSRDPEPPRDPDDEGPAPTGHIRTTGPGSLTVLAVVGLVLGWVLRPLSIAVNGTAPTVGWLPVLALGLVAAIIAAVAASTYRALQVRHEHLEPHRAVNRLVLAKSCALAGALVAGGYFGYALSWVGITEGDLAKQRILQGVLAGLASVLTVAGSLVLERACRVRRHDS
jgi:cytochrome bd-type quinol oxidase subunit 2